MIHYWAYTALAGIPMFGFAYLNGILCALSTVLLGIALEFLQRLVPGRSFETADILANTVGALIVIAVWGSLQVMYLRQSRRLGS